MCRNAGSGEPGSAIEGQRSLKEMDSSGYDAETARTLPRRLLDSKRRREIGGWITETKRAKESRGT